MSIYWMREWGNDDAQLKKSIINYENLWIEFGYWTALLEETGWLSYKWNTT